MNYFRPYMHYIYRSDQSAMLDLSISKNIVKLLWAKEDSYKLTGFLKFVSNLEMRQLWILPASAVHHSHVLLSFYVKLWIPFYIPKRSDVSKQESIWSLLHTTYVHDKGQLISKWIFGVIDFLQKTNEWIRLYYYDTSGRLVFVRFLEEINDPKKPFRN